MHIILYHLLVVWGDARRGWYTAAWSRQGAQIWLVVWLAADGREGGIHQGYLIHTTMITYNCKCLTQPVYVIHKNKCYTWAIEFMCDSLYTVIKHLNIACGEAQGSGNARAQQTAIINAAFEKKEVSSCRVSTAPPCGRSAWSRGRNTWTTERKACSWNVLTSYINHSFMHCYIFT